MKDTTKEAAGGAQEKASETAGGLKEKAGEAAGTLKEKAGQAAGAVKETVMGALLVRAPHFLTCWTCACEVVALHSLRWRRVEFQKIQVVRF